MITFGPTQGREQSGKRPALVLSPKNYNITGLCIVCPITSKSKGYRFEVKVEDSNVLKGVILTDHIKTLDWQDRGYEYIEKMSKRNIFETQQRIALMIGIDLDFLKQIFI